MALACRQPGEAVGRNRDVKMATLARARVTGMRSAVVADFQKARVQCRFQRRPQALDARGTHGAFPGAVPRISQTTTPMVNANTSGITTQDLNVTQVDSLMV